MKKIVIGLSLLVVALAVTVLVNQKEGSTGLSLLSAIKGDNGRFEKLLSYVPNDTPYLIGNKKALPEAYMDKQIEKIQNLVNVFKDIITKENNRTKVSTEMDFISNYYAHFMKAYKEDTLESMGFEKGYRSVVYGYGFYPVVRSEIVDSKAFIETINRIAKESNTSVEWESCGAYQCIKSDTEKSEFTATFVVKEKSIAFSFYNKNIQEEMLKHLSENKAVDKAYSIKKFDTLLAKNNFQGYGDGFVNLETLTHRLLSEFEAKLSEQEKASFKRCSPIAVDLSTKMNQITFGTTELSTDKMSMSMIFNTDSNVSTSLKALTNKNLFTQRVNRPLFDLGINLNAQGLSQGLMELANYVANEGEKYGCTEIKSQALRQGAAMASMSIGMTLGQFSQLYISMNDFEMDKNAQMPKKVGANIQIGTANPASLIGMLKMFVPELASLNIPATGEEVDLLKHAPKPVPPFITALTASMTDKVIALRLGDKMEMKAFKPKEHTLLWSQIDNKKYSKIIKMAMEQGKKAQKASLMNSPQAEQAQYEAMMKDLEKNDAKVKKLLETLYQSDAVSSQSIYVDDRGLVMEFSQRED